MPPIVVRHEAHNIGSRYGYVSNSVPANVPGHRSAGLCRKPPMAGATQLARPKHSAKRLNAFACCDLEVTSPTYVFTTPALPFRRPVRNLPATHWAYVVLVPKMIAVNVEVNIPTSMTGLRPTTSERAPQA